MKKLFLTITVILSLLLGLSSCGNLSYEYNYNCLENDDVKFTISASIQDDTYEALSTCTSERSITPSSSLTSYANYTYYLVSQNLKSGVYYVKSEPVNLTADFSQGNTGIIDMDLTPANYEFTLYALRTPLSAGFTRSDIITNAILTGSTQVDLRIQTSTYTPDISFVLKPTEVAMSSNVILSFYTTPDWTFDSTKYSVYAAMYGNDNTIYGTSGVTQFYDLPQGTAPSTPQYRTTVDGGIRSGLYEFELVFTKNSDTTKQYTYSTSVYVLPGTDTVASVAVPNVIEYEPLSPSNLKASYKNPANDSQDYYVVDLSWSDNSNNEYYFQLDLLTLNDYSDPSNITASDTPWTSSYYTLLSSANVTSYGRNFQTSSIYNSGSLSANSTSAQIKLELGKVYIARLSAVNDAGQSDYTYIDFSNGGTGTSGFTAFPTDTKALNRYRVSYNPCGGTWTMADSTTSNSAIVEYHSYGSTSIKQSFPDSEVTSLIKEAINWTKWKEGSISGDDYTSSAYTGFDNLSLFAIY